MLENADGGTEGSLISALDHCATVMGKRRLRAWLCRPMARIADITARQDAVADFMGWPASEAAQTARCTLSGKTEAAWLSQQDADYLLMRLDMITFIIDEARGLQGVLWEPSAPRYTAQALGIPAHLAVPEQLSQTLREGNLQQAMTWQQQCQRTNSLPGNDLVTVFPR